MFFQLKLVKFILWMNDWLRFHIIFRNEFFWLSLWNEIEFKILIWLPFISGQSLHGFLVLALYLIGGHPYLAFIGDPTFMFC